MGMSERAQRAFDELQAIGAPVMAWGKEEGYGDGVAFVLIWASDDGSEVFADITGRRIRERVENGKYINPMGYRQDVHEILAKHRMVTDWHNHGQVVVYEDPDAPGFNHARDRDRDVSRGK